MSDQGLFVVREVTEQALCAAALAVPSVGAIPAVLFWPVPIAAVVAGSLAAGVVYDAAWAAALAGAVFTVKAVLHAQIAWHAYLWERNWNRVLYRERTFL